MGLCFVLNQSTLHSNAFLTHLMCRASLAVRQCKEVVILLWLSTRQCFFLNERVRRLWRTVMHKKWAPQVSIFYGLHISYDYKF